MEDKKAKPFLKWAGGKTQLINDIEKVLPKHILKEKFTYVEPFVGSGAVLFWMLNNVPNVQRAIINDINEDLINTYKTIASKPSELISILQILQSEFHNIDGNAEAKKAYYYSKRDLYNKRSEEQSSQAALFIFLNRTCFNGLYRVNRKNEYNVPMGSYKRPTICDRENILAVSQVLQKVEILCGDYEETLNYADNNSLFYFDPPYKPLSETSSFNSYAKDEFNDREQIRLRDFCHKLDTINHAWILSNSDVKGKDENDNFFDDLYSDFNIQRVDAKRSINANPEKRGALKELLITNQAISQDMSEQFKIFLSQLSETNATLDYFTDFKKIKGNVNKIEIKLNQLNYLIGKSDIKAAVNELYEENPKVFEVLDILIAVRKKDKKKTFNRKGNIVLVESYFESLESIIEFIEDTGLANLFQNKDIKNLVDYVFGVEAGLDTNARKNRGGDNMSRAVLLFFDNAKIFYKREVKSTEFPEILSLGVDVKRFDFVIKTKRKTYLIETNFYNGGGSKLNETARSYSDVAPKINQYENYEFVWITDGQGWLSAKNKLEEAYNLIPSMYNLTTLSSLIEKVKAENVLNVW